VIKNVPLRRLSASLHLVIWATATQFKVISKSTSLEMNLLGDCLRYSTPVPERRRHQRNVSSVLNVRWKATIPSFTPNQKKCALVIWVLRRRQKTIKFELIIKGTRYFRGSKARALSSRGAARKNQIFSNKTPPFFFFKITFGLLVTKRWIKSLELNRFSIFPIKLGQ